MIGLLKRINGHLLTCTCDYCRAVVIEQSRVRKIQAERTAGAQGPLRLMEDVTGRESTPYGDMPTRVVARVAAELERIGRVGK